MSSTWNHMVFAVEVNGQRFTPYMSIEGEWRVNQNIQADNQQRPSFTELPDLIMHLNKATS